MDRRRRVAEQTVLDAVDALKPSRSTAFNIWRLCHMSMLKTSMAIARLKATGVLAEGVFEGRTVYWRRREKS